MLCNLSHIAVLPKLYLFPRDTKTVSGPWPEVFSFECIYHVQGTTIRNASPFLAITATDSTLTQIQDLEMQQKKQKSETLRSVHQLAHVQQQAAESTKRAEAAAAKAGAEAVAASVARETVMNRNLAGLQSEMEVTCCWCLIAEAHNVAQQA